MGWVVGIEEEEIIEGGRNYEGLSSGGNNGCGRGCMAVFVRNSG